jgi:hypothetical protein
MKLKEKFVEMEQEFIVCWGEYLKLNDELDLYRGKPISEDNTDTINKLIQQIQEKFIEMYPVMVFVMERYAFCNKALANYNKFVDDIKKAGATPINEAQA